MAVALPRIAASNRGGALMDEFIGFPTGGKATSDIEENPRPAGRIAATQVAEAGRGAEQRAADER
jgi:hypothetical protein